ncbi:Piwi-domain-containing protein [Stereum hirsutum FP-91666 SS1]|uniref:Piwi-domain-containing protein n=1 Tax=Stereum hirsutum (strain FP-91666) TaxID=721885 RepID=UPI0004449433|nr:Piwi-domain-containing protein [Stereum hirsutum FP-91666 SS1]EIM82439.1 Piwi-domain-containing protein [Stereum hirsutum FP-91666 SS1]
MSHQYSPPSHRGQYRGQQQRGGSSQQYRGSQHQSFPSRQQQRGPRPKFDEVLPVNVFVNAFKVEIDDNPAQPELAVSEFYQYDAAIRKKSESSDGERPTSMPPRRAYQIVYKAQTQVYPALFHGSAFDGKSILYAPQDILGGQPSGQFPVDMSDRPPQANQPDRGVYIIYITRVSSIDIRTLKRITRGEVEDAGQTAVSLVQALVRQAPLVQTNTFTARAVYQANLARINLGQGIDLMRGYFQSVRTAPGQMIINVDISSACVYAPIRLVDFAQQFLNMRNTNELIQLDERDRDWKILRSILKFVRVHVNTTVRRSPSNMNQDQRPAKPIKDIVPRAGHYEFVVGQDMWTVRDHYRRAHGVHLQHPDLFGVMIGDAVFPAEDCSIPPGQLFRKRIPQKLMTALHGHTSQSPSRRLQAIKDGVAGQFLNYSGSTWLRQAGISIEQQPLEITASILPQPKVSFKRMEGGNIITDVIRTTDKADGPGVWDVMGKKFFEPATIKLWAVVNFSKAHPDQVMAFAKNLQKACRTLGMIVEDIKEPVQAGNGQIPKVALEGIVSITVKAPDFVLVVLPDDAEPIRRAVKFWGDIERGVPTQCVKVGKMMGARDQYYNNVAIKMNAKKGGINWTVRNPALDDVVRSGPTMIIGADVSHPPPRVLRPSIASIVGSYDISFSKYAYGVRLQNPRQEIIGDLKEMMQAMLRIFTTEVTIKGKLPPPLPLNIFYYRDGVSEGEYDNVLATEARAIQEAWDLGKAHRKDKHDPAKLNIVFIIVGKRHHIRFFPTQSSDAGGLTDRSGNVVSGLCVDTAITTPSRKRQDFYLQSQCGLKGTSRSSHYIVLRNDRATCQKYSMGLKQIQDFSFALCFNYARATRSVSIPSPIYYADLLCTRAAFHFADTEDPDLQVSSDGNDSNATFDLERWKGIFRRSKIRSMFFM